MRLKRIIRRILRGAYHLLCRNLLFYQMNNLRFIDDERKNFRSFVDDIRTALSKQTPEGEVYLRSIFIEFRVIGNLTDILVELLRLRHNNLNFDFDKYRSLIKEINIIPSKTFNEVKWKKLSYAVGNYGLFRLSFCCYSKALEVALEERSNKTNKELAGEMFALMETADVSGAIKLFSAPRVKKMFQSKLYTELMWSNKLSDVQLFVAVLRKDQNKIEGLMSKRFTEKEYAYLNYIDGKTVAIVGPAFTDDDNGEEIDKFDIVVRLNYRGKSKMSDKRKSGTKTHISYYNMEYALAIGNYEDKGFLKDLDFWVIKSQDTSLTINETDSYNNRERVNIALNYAHMFDGTPNMIQLVILDLLLFKPQKIKIFNSNFFAAKKLYQNGYISSEQKSDNKGWFYSFTEHGIISNLSLMRNLWYAGYYEPDDDMRQVLEMTNEEYMGVIEDIYME